MFLQKYLNKQYGGGSSSGLGGGSSSGLGAAGGSSIEYSPPINITRNGPVSEVIAVMSDGRIAVGIGFNYIILWDYSGPTITSIPLVHGTTHTEKNTAKYMLSLPNNKLIVHYVHEYNYSRSSIVVWDLDQGKIRKSNVKMFSDYSVIKFLLLSDESVAICTTDREVRVWDFNKYKADYISPIKRLIHPNRVEAIEELSNGIIVTGCYDKIIRFWDITDPLKGALINQIVTNGNDFQFFSLPNNRLFSKIGIWQDSTEYNIWDFNDFKNIKKFNLPKLGSMVSNDLRLVVAYHKFYLLNDLRLVVAYHYPIGTPVIPPKIVVWDLTVTPPTAITLFETRHNAIVGDFYKVTFLGELEPGIIICSYLTISNENCTCVWDINGPLPTSKFYIGMSIAEVLVDNRILYLQKIPSVDTSYSSYHTPGWGLGTFPGIDGESYYLRGITRLISNQNLVVGRVPAREILTFPLPPVPTPSYSKLKDFELSDEITLRNYLEIKSKVECPICKVNIKKIILNCNHSFCETCSSTLENCPTCSSTIDSKKNIHNKYISY